MKTSLLTSQIIRQILTLTILAISVSLNACTCRNDSTFEFWTYEEARLIVEIEVVRAEKPWPQTPRQLAYREHYEEYLRTMANWEDSLAIPPPPPVPLPPRIMDSVWAEVITTFKGTVVRDTITLSSHRTSCRWLPKFGERYLLYLGAYNNDIDGNVYSVDACTKRIPSAAPDAADERATLHLLASCPSKPFVIYDRWEKRWIGTERPLVTGRFTEGLKSGTWTIYRYPSSNKADDGVREVFELYYRRGELFGGKMLEEDERMWGKPTKYILWEMTEDW